MVRGELILYRDRLYALIARGEYHRTETSKPPVVSPKLLDHDRRAFREADEVLSETQLRELLNGLVAEHSFVKWTTLPIKRLVDHFALESNKFVIEDLEAVADDLSTTLTDLDGFLTKHFFVYPNDQGIDDEDDGLRQYCMQPEWNIECSGKAEDAQRYEALANELAAVVERTRSAFAEYRRSVKRTLMV